MAIVAQILVALVALLHLGFLWLEMFAWDRMARRLNPRTTAEMIDGTRVLAANQGLYNGFLAAGLFWSLMIGDADWARNVAVFFLICVLVAGLYGAATASRRILYVQALPAVLALAAVFAA